MMARSVLIFLNLFRKKLTRDEWCVPWNGRSRRNSFRPRLEGEMPSPFLFIGSRGSSLSGLTRQAVSSMLRDLARRANISHVSAHMLRHGAATHMLDHGADLRTIQTILGHADISTTEIYTKVSQVHLRSVLARCHPRWKPRAQMPLFQAAPLPQSGPIICSDCRVPAITGKTRCGLHLLLCAEASKRSYKRKRMRLVAASTDSLKKLKTAGVPNPVILAMVRAS
jgi:hypothetical protein